MPKCVIDLDASPTFKKLLRTHSRKLRKLVEDFEEVFSRIEQDFRNAAQAEAIPGFDQTIWKYRCKCSDLRQGTSGGIRIIAYYNAETNILYPLTFYFKRDQDDIANRTIQDIIDEFKTAVNDQEKDG